MNHLPGCLVVLLACSSCLFTDTRYTGDVSRCDDSNDSANALLIMDNPRGPTSFTGWWGVGGDTQRDTWNLAHIEDGTSDLNGLKFEVEYFTSTGTDTSLRSQTTVVWNVDLEPAGNGKWEGKATTKTTTITTIFGVTTTSETSDRCDVELAAAED